MKNIKRTEKEKNIQWEEFKKHPFRRRKLVKVICEIKEPAWSRLCVFKETLQIVEKRTYERIDLFNSKKLEGLCPKWKESEYINEDGKVCVLMVNYGNAKYDKIQGMDGRLAPVCCKAQDFDKYEIGLRVPIYLKKWE